ncbi:MAG: RNA polymerase sigma factor [Lachnospiraceae bacterium]
MKKDLYDKIVDYILENQNRFYRLAFSYVRNREDAVDIVQNAVVKALEHYRDLRNENAVHTWFYRILVNESLLFLKRKKEVYLEDRKDIPEIPYQEKGYEPQDNLNISLESLDNETQTVIRLRFFEEMSLKEIAEITATNLNTVKARLYRGLRMLKKNIEEADL